MIAQNVANILRGHVKLSGEGLDRRSSRSAQTL